MARSAIVVGGGIGGLATARALLATGWDVTVLEQASALAPVGAGLGLAPNGVRALDWLGLGEELRSRGMAQGPAGIRTASGRWLLRTRFEELQRRVGVPTFAVHRADLHRMLAKAVDDAVLRTGHEGQAARHDGDRATVSYRSPDGLGHASADLVVAADGVHSRLRTTLFPEHPGVTYAGYVTWRGVVPAASVGGMSLEPGITETWGRGKRFGVVPLGDGQVYWFAGASLPEGAHAGDGVADVATRPRSQRLVRASARAGRMAQASHPGLAGLRNLAAWLTPTPLYLRATTGTFSWTPSTALTAR